MIPVVTSIEAVAGADTAEMGIVGVPLAVCTLPSLVLINAAAVFAGVVAGAVPVTSSVIPDGVVSTGVLSQLRSTDSTSISAWGGWPRTTEEGIGTVDVDAGTALSISFDAVGVMGVCRGKERGSTCGRGDVRRREGARVAD